MIGCRSYVDAQSNWWPTSGMFLQGHITLATTLAKEM